MIVVINKAARRLTVRQDAKTVLCCAVALGRCSEGHKRVQGDGRTPEGRYTICIEKAQGKYGRSLGLSYPNAEDARSALKDGRIDCATCEAILRRLEAGERPPWGTPLGGEIYLHGGGAQSDWTQGCIALEDDDMERLYALRHQITLVEILP